MPHTLASIKKEIVAHPSNLHFLQRGYDPLFLASSDSKIVIIGQAPGIRAQEKGRVWDDASGERLMRWLGVNEETFRDPKIFAHLPMDFYYPGKGASGDLPPRKEFASLWHEKILACMPQVELIILVGSYAQNYYLKKVKQKNLTETVKRYKDYLPHYFPVVHPSPLNFRWFLRHPWFEETVVPNLQKKIHQIIDKLKR